MRRLSPLLALLLALTVAPLAARPHAPAAPAALAEPPTPAQVALPAYAEARDATAVRNDVLFNAEPVGDPARFSWAQTISGTIDSSADVDYYALDIARPASSIAITLAGPQADYDLVLAGGEDTSQDLGTGDALQEGLEEITQIGGSIKSIGGSIKSIGGSIKSIGGSIKSIGGSIKSIGGSIKSISATAGTASEAIETQLWLPGRYYVVVTTANGEFGAAPYTLSITLADSGLSRPPPSPEVDVRLTRPFYADPADVTTLYIFHPGRMARLYPGSASDGTLSLIDSYLFSLASGPQPNNNAPPDYGVVLDLSQLQPTVAGGQTITQTFDLWASAENQANPLYANYLAGLIDNVIESAIAGQPSGPGAAFQLGNASAGVVGFPNVRNVVLVGGDEVIPFYRLPDLTEIANEAEYADYLRTINANGIIGADSPLGAALRYSMLLTDSPYGSGRPYGFYGFPFYVPRLAVGRLVETPADVLAFLGHYANNDPAAFQIDATAFGRPNPPRRAFVSGYDFLKDQAAAVGTVLRQTGLQPDEFNVLVNDEWGRPELEREWFDGALGSEFPEPPGSVFFEQANIDLSSVNAHFDHWQLLPAANPSSSSEGNFPARRLLDPTYDGESFFPAYFGGTLGYSVGCHSGYNVVASAVVPGGRAAGGPAQAYDPALYRADFAEALNRHGGNWVGNTGYGYGTADGIDYSERLAVLYTQELVRATYDITGTQIPASIGEALVNAKQRYVRNAASLSAYDYKVLSVMTLYGMPQARVLVSNPLEPPAEDPAPNRPDVPLEIQSPVSPDRETGRLTRTITFTIRVDASDFRTVPRTGSTIYDLDPADFVVEDEFNQLGGFPLQAVRTFNNNQVGMPTLPTFAYDIGVASAISPTERLRVLDVVFLRGSYDNRPAFDPQMTTVATETLDATPIVSRTDEPAFEAGAGIWYPDTFFGFSSVGEGAQQRDQLTSFAAQFRADSDGTTGLLRPYGQMVFRITYDDPGVTTQRAGELDADRQAPVIESVRIRPAGAPAGLAQDSRATIVVRASDGAPDYDGADRNQGLAEVSAIYVKDGVSWEPLTLQETAAGSGVYTAGVPLPPGAARFIVRATDVAGNSSYYTAKGRFTPYATVRLPLVQR